MLLAALYVVSLPVVWCAVRSIPKECDMKYYTHYIEYGCKPIFGSGPCPVKFDCDALNARSSSKCYFNGTEYSPGKDVGDVESACQASCYCRDEGDNRAAINCAQNECPEHIGPDPRRQGCRLQYKEGGCCADSYICPNEIASFKGATCEYEGRTYYEDEKFYPENECKFCICKGGFDGKLEEPWCKDILCGIEIHQRGGHLLNGCTPVYYKDGCCPITYRCPEDKDEVLPGPANCTSTSSTDKCTFGSLLLNVSDKLSSNDACEDCTCRIPPVLTCVRTC